MNTGTLSYGDIHDKEKGIDVGVEVSMDFGGKKSNDTKNGNAKNDNAKNNSKISSGSLGYGATDREQINRGTIGKGTVIVGEIKVTPGINRDEGKSQEVTKDINVDKIDVEYTADRRKWGDTSNIMGEYSQTLTSDIDNVAGTKFNKKYGDVGQTSWLWVEDKVIDPVLNGGIFFDKKIGVNAGIFPTKKGNGGILGVRDNIAEGGDDEAILGKFKPSEKIDLDKIKVSKDEKLIIKVDGQGVRYTADEFKAKVDSGG